MCFNKKVVAALAVAGVAIFLFAPNLISAALPLLILAACPLSMLVMMKMMSGDKSKAASTGSGTTATDIDAELASLRAEVTRLRSDRPRTDATPELN
jgi:hypothetical protein